MTIHEIRLRFPNASSAFIAANLSADAPGLRSNNKKPTQRNALVGGGEGEGPRWYGAAKRFEITYRIFSQRPCDYDGYDIKAIQDLLVKAEILPDDKWCVLSGRTISEKAHTLEEERTEITIEIIQ